MVGRNKANVVSLLIGFNVDRVVLVLIYWSRTRFHLLGTMRFRTFLDQSLSQTQESALVVAYLKSSNSTVQIHDFHVVDNLDYSHPKL